MRFSSIQQYNWSVFLFMLLLLVEIRVQNHTRTLANQVHWICFFFETECLVFFPWNWIFHFDQSIVVHTMGPYSSCKIQRKMEAVCIIMIKWARKDETCVTSVSRIHRLITNNISGHWKCALLVCVVEVFIFFFSFLCVLVFFFYIFVYKIMCIRLNWTRYVSLCPWNAGGMYSLNSMHRASVFELVVSACMCRIF